MGLKLKDVGNRVDNSRVSAAQNNRNVATATPEFDAGMSDDYGFDSVGGGNIDTGNMFNAADPFATGNMGGGADPFGNMGGGADPFGNMGGGADPFGNMGGGADPFGNMGGAGTFGADPFGNMGGMGGFGGMQQPQQAEKPLEDKVYEAVGAGAKQSLNFFKDFIASFKTCDAVVRATWGRYAAIISIIVLVLSIVLLIFGRPQFGIQLLIGSILSLATGIVLLCISQDQANAMGNSPTPPEVPQDIQMGDTMENMTPTYNQDFGWGGNDFAAEDDDDEDGFDAEEFDTLNVAFNGDNNDIAVDFGGSIDNVSFDDTTDFSSMPSNAESTPQSFDNLPTTGLIDRRSLYEHISSVLSTITPDYSRIDSTPEGSELFQQIDSIVQDCAEIFKPPTANDNPILLSAKETIFSIRLEITRVKWLKNIQQYAEEIIKKFAYDPDTGIIDEDVYGSGEAVGQSIFVNIMKGETAMVSIKDIYKTNEADILDIDKKMPVVVGIGIDGKPVIKNFLKYFSLLVTGMPRTGKTWFLMALLYQMLSYMSPRELNIYIFDPKGIVSDFKFALTPHVRKFVADKNTIIAQLKYLVRVEGPRRKDEIGKAGFVNIEDYKKACPDVDMPYIYVIMDEIISIVTGMDDNKEDKQEFQGLLLELVSQLPATGIRIMMVPHLVKDNIVKKNITSLIPCRISVMGNKEHIEDSCGVKNFDYTLTHTGDMCVKLSDEKSALFVHSVVLAKNNEENKRMFEYLGDMWARICPDTVEGSVYDRYKKYGIDGIVDKIDSPSMPDSTNDPFVQKTSNVRSVPTDTKTVNRVKTTVKSTTQQATAEYDWGNDIRNNGTALNLNATDEDLDIDLFDDSDF